MFHKTSEISYMIFTKLFYHGMVQMKSMNFTFLRCLGMLWMEAKYILFEKEG